MPIPNHPRAWLLATSAMFLLAPGTSLGGDSPAAKPTAAPTTSAPAPIVRISPERLEMLRRSMMSKLAVYDVAEGAMRQPTAAEAQALTAGMTPGAERIVALPRGGAALRVDASALEYLIVEIGTDGSKSMRHGQAASVGSKASASKEGHRHAQ